MIGVNSLNILILGGAGFIGTNLTFTLAREKNNTITLFDKEFIDFSHITKLGFGNISIVKGSFDLESDFVKITAHQDVVYHLVSTTVPTTSNQKIAEELMANVVTTSKFLDACVKNKVKKVMFLSSGGTVYGKEKVVPLNEDTTTNPISSYGIQKITIEKLLYLYQYLYGLDYRVVRLANPYGPYQRPNGVLGAVTTFTYKALKHEAITVYGDGSVVRDFLFIDDAVRGILNILNSNNQNRVFNLGSGKGTSIKEVIETIQEALDLEIDIQYVPGRKVDVPINILDIGLYEGCFGKFNPLSLKEGVLRTAEFMRKVYKI